MKAKQTLIKCLSTFFYTGYLPLIPGTFGSLAGLLVYFLVRNNYYIYILTIGLLLAVGFLVSGKAERIFNKKDPSVVVIDEVCGMLICLMFVPFDIKYVVCGFVLFRILDTLKPFPAGRLQHLKGSLGIMIDDIIAGLYANILLQVVFRLAAYRGS